MKRAFLILFVIFLFILGCGEPAECKVASDCGITSGCVDSYSCLDKKCKTNWKEDCCGNNRADEIEDGGIGNECTCPEDWGECELDVSMDANFFEGGCLDDICGVDVKELATKKEDVTKPTDFSKFDAMVKVNFDSPFDVKTSLFDIEFEMTDIDDGTVEPKITKVQVEGTLGRTKVTLAEKDINKILWMPGSKVNDEIFLTYEPKDSVEDMSVKLIVNYEYTRRIEGREDTIVRDSKTIEIKGSRDKLKFLTPTRDYICSQSDCDDNNPGTIDICIDDTPFCEHRRRPGVCGNYVCESNENKCTCSFDCGPCEGSFGTYLGFGCSSLNQCITKLKVPSQQTIFKYDKDSSYFTVSSYATFNQPFDVNLDLVNIRIQLINAKDHLIPPLKIEKIDITSSSGESLGELVAVSGNTISNVYGQVSFDIPLNFIMNSFEEEKTFKYTVYYYYQYEKKDSTGNWVVDEKRDSFERDIGSKVMFVEVGS